MAAVWGCHVMKRSWAGWPSTPCCRRTGIDYEAILAGYRDPVPVEEAAFWIYRLDAAVMLALLFNAEMQHAKPGPSSVDRLREVPQRLIRELAR